MPELPELGPIEGALAELVRRLERLRIPYMVMGGVALFVRADPRSTRDLDVSVLVPRAGVPALLAGLAPAFSPRPGDPVAFAQRTNVLHMIGPDLLPVDLMLAAVPFEEQAIERSTPEAIGRTAARVITAEDLILMKLVADRPQDRVDVAAIVRKNRRTLDRAQVDPLVANIARELDRP